MRSISVLTWQKTTLLEHNSFEDHPWILRLVDYVGKLYRDTQKPIVGICFGHQIIARALGTPVQRSTLGWEVSVDEISMTPEGQKLFGVDKLVSLESSLCCRSDRGGGIPRILSPLAHISLQALHQMHRDIVTAVPEGAINLGHSAVCDVQGLYIPHRVISVQAHPEFSGFIMSSILDTRRGQGIFGEDLYQSGLSRADKTHDGVLVSTVIWRFLLSGDL